MTVLSQLVTQRGNFIGGRWLESAYGKTAPDINPADVTDVIGAFPISGEDDVNEAVAAAVAAGPSWASLSPVVRGRYLAAAARRLEARLEEVSHDLSREEGKTIGEAMAEVRRAIAVLDFYAGAGMRLGGTLHPSERPGFRIQVRREPLGVVAAVTPWNFPIAIPAWKVAPALVAGNTVVLKPASLTPLTAINLVRALAEAELPDGVVNLVLGPGGSVGELLATHPDVQALTFTGSTVIGRHLFQVGSMRFKRVQAEMGGHNPVVVLADADLDDASAIVADGAFLSTGQKCTATRRVIVERPAVESFVERLVRRAASLRLGNPLDPKTNIGPVVSPEQLELNCQAVGRALQEGARVAVGGTKVTEGALERGNFFAPTVLTNVRPESEVAQSEVFGPIVSVFDVPDIGAAVRLANDVDYGLSAAVCTRDLDQAERFISASQSGVVAVNAPTAGMEVQVPIHGVKGSGLGAPEQGDLALDFFTNVKTVYFRSRV